MPNEEREHPQNTKNRLELELGFERGRPARFDGREICVFTVEMHLFNVILGTLPLLGQGVWTVHVYCVIAPAFSLRACTQHGPQH